MIPALQQEPLASLWQHWNDIRGDKPVPEKADVDLVELASILPQVSLLDAVSPDEMRYMLVGSEIVARSGEELTGINLLDLFTPECRPFVSRCIIDLFNVPCALVCRTTILYQSGNTAMSQSLCLPLQKEKGAIGTGLFCARDRAKRFPY